MAADLGGDEHDRDRADGRRRRLVLEELEDLGAEHHRPGRRADRLTEAERAAVDRLRHGAVVDDVVGQRPGTLRQAGPLGRHGGAERSRVADEAVGGGQGVDHLTDHEPGPLLALVVEPEPADGVVGHGRGAEVPLEHPPVDRVGGPGGVGEAAVAGLWFPLRLTADGGGQLPGQPQPGAGQADGVAGPAGRQPGGRRQLGPAQRHQRHRPGHRRLGLFGGRDRDRLRSHPPTVPGGRVLR